MMENTSGSSKIEVGTLSQRTPDQVSCDRAIRYSGFFGVRSVGPVGDFLDIQVAYKKPYAQYSDGLMEGQEHKQEKSMIHSMVPEISVADCLGVFV